MEPLIARVDHVFVPVEDPKPLFDLFTGTLGLPAAWPVTDYGLFESAGVCLGNCNLEIVRGDGSINPYFEPQLPATVRGIALEPALPPTAWEAALEKRELGHTPPFPFEQDGEDLWTTSGIGGLVAQAAIVFLCAYHAELGPRGFDAVAALRDADGGVLGVERLQEITIGVQDDAASLRAWTRLMRPHEPDTPGVFRAGDGPGIRVKRSPIDGVAGLVVQVRSLAVARAALRERGLLGPSRSSGIGLNYPATFGLDVWLVE